ncbi:preprotein translocase subunit SecG [Isoalcanivorax beigongshangi]|uniref:Protein-export membrane protein SecG n=1 Tax=Isoalcanivorax beigongshangi TaxID=3238810 RepID=A0ABV4ADG4_9GAMM
MEIVLHVIHVVAALAVIGLVLIQHGKGADAGASFGGGASASQSLFGSSGSGSFLTRMTAICAAVFMLTSLGLAWYAGQASKSIDSLPVLERLQQQSNEVPVLDEDLMLAPQTDADVPELVIPEESALEIPEAGVESPAAP